MNISFNFEQANLFKTLFKEHTPHRKRSPPLKRGFKKGSQKTRLEVGRTGSEEQETLIDR